ncbi:beta-galactosidase [Irregularibacter muris]|uniref:Beta-galactosidase n=1 Tax=Irregularibacter muris TaxID=1796619 RepID=A0AAE3HDL0_9FIRM|nr:beta-galactosidase [Irregularibacter muris]MCR1898536.1 beta-galactosidase [Irregularibacter muris]
MYLGVDYYPEHWEANRIEEDIGRIKQMGANIIRIGEFAWHLMEPKEGQYDFSFFDGVVEKAKQYDINIMFGTPTATFPAWLAKKYPSILSEDKSGNKRVFGGRRQYCFHSDRYQEYTKKIVEKLVHHYRNEKAIIAWQIDNEFGHEGSDLCYCEQCHRKFQEFLKEKYETIQELNHRYGTIFWGQTYNDFDEIPIPKDTITIHNPGLLLDWSRFRSFSIKEYAKMQIAFVRQLKGEHQQITHNFAGGFFEKFYDHNEVADQLDFVSYDNYPVWGGLSKPLEPAQIAMAHDFMRGLKNKNYWIVEELMGAQGHDVIGYLPRPNQAKMWAYQAMAHGCANLLFFRWRSMTKGAEQFCLGIIDHDNEEGRKYQEVQSFMNEVQKYQEVIRSEIKSDIAILYSYDNIWSWNHQRQSPSFDFTKELLRLYRPFYVRNTNIDVISTEKDFTKYKILVVPVMQMIDEKLGKAFENFVKQGGTIVYSFRAGIRDRDNNIHFKNVFPCFIGEMTGITIKESEPLPPNHYVNIIGKEEFQGTKGTCSFWRDLIIPENARVLYGYDDQFYGNRACITENSYGKGKVYYIGGAIDEDTLQSIMDKIIHEKSIVHIKSPKGLEVYEREYNHKKWLFINNHTSQEIIFENRTISPYGSKIMEK